MRFIFSLLLFTPTFLCSQPKPSSILSCCPLPVFRKPLQASVTGPELLKQQQTRTRLLLLFAPTPAAAPRLKFNYCSPSINMALQSIPQRAPGAVGKALLSSSAAAPAAAPAPNHSAWLPALCPPASPRSTRGLPQGWGSLSPLSVTPPHLHTEGCALLWHREHSRTLDRTSLGHRDITG